MNSSDTAGTGAPPRRLAVRLLPSGTTLAVEPGQTVLAAAIAAGVALPYSCKNGMCRSCIGRVASGAVEQRGVDPRHLGDRERADGFALLCCTRPLDDCSIEVELRPQTRARPQQLPARLVAVERAAADVAVLRLRLPMNKRLHFEAGQYADVLLEDGARRSYSIASAPAADGVGEIELHVRHLPGGLFTDRVFGTLQPSAILRIEAPLGSFALQPGSGPVIMLAGGTGFAPLQSMVEHALASGLTARRRFHVYWGMRRGADFYRLARARQWAGVQVVPVVSEVDRSWPGRSGLVHEAVMADFADLAGAQVYACGSPAMVDAARRDFVARRGLPPSAFFADAFLSSADRAPAARAAPLTTGA